MTSVPSTYALSSSFRASLLEIETQLARARQELSTGRHADVSLTAGAAVARDVHLGARLDQLNTIFETNKIVGARLDTTQIALSSLTSTAADVRATLLRALSDGGDRKAIVAQARLALASFTATLNQTIGGDYVFGGENLDAAPAADYFAAPPSANKLALDNAFLSAFGMTQSDPAAASISAPAMESFLSVEMSALFSPPNWAADWSQASDEPLLARISFFKTTSVSITANDPAFRELAMGYTALSDLSLDALSDDAGDAVIRTAAQHIDRALAGLTKLKAAAGGMQAEVESANRTMTVQQGLFLSQIASIEGVDPTEAATRVNGLMTQIEIAYTLTAKIQQLSLVKYL